MMICAWCKCTIIPQQDGDAIPHSHGICKACAKRERAEGIKAARRLRRELDAYVDERAASERPGPVEHTLSTLYGVPLSLSQVF